MCKSGISIKYLTDEFRLQPVSPLRWCNEQRQVFPVPVLKARVTSDRAVLDPNTKRFK